MLNEFYDYIAKKVVGFFQGMVSVLQQGDRYCLRLDTEEMVQGVHEALQKYTAKINIQGQFQYKSVYQTYTIRLFENQEVVVASKIHGMTDDFLATLRNAELTDRHFPILMITDSPIDSIVSGTADLASRGMPFHSETLQKSIREDLRSAYLKPIERVLVEAELAHKQEDRFSDKTSLFEYSDILTVLNRGYVKSEDFSQFGLIDDPEGQYIASDKELEKRLEKNRQHFEQINHAYQHGNISDDLGRIYERALIEGLEKKKRDGKDWWEGLTYETVQSSAERLNAKQGIPLELKEETLSVYSSSPQEYLFGVGHLCFIRCDGETKTKQRIKNILIYNPSHRDIITLCIEGTKTMRNPWVAKRGKAHVDVTGKRLSIRITTTGCTFEQITVKDPNNESAKHILKICIVDVAPCFLESLQTAYTIEVKSGADQVKSRLCVAGITNELRLNPNKEHVLYEPVVEGNEYDCQLNQELCLSITEQSINSDLGYSDIFVRCGAVNIPLRIKDEKVKLVPINGKQIFKTKYHNQQGLEYRNEHIIDGTREYFIIDRELRHNLELEKTFIDDEWFAGCENAIGVESYPLELDLHIQSAYIDFLRILKQNRLLPSLSYYTSDIAVVAQKYVNSVMNALQDIKPGTALTSTQNNLLLLGAVIDHRDDSIIKLSPLHPLNVLYQLSLMQETGVGEIRDQLVERLTPLFMLPYLRDQGRDIYHAVEQKHSPEWRYYARSSNKRYQGARSFVQKLVSEKIEHYIKHFPFLFEDLGNKSFIINLVNMGDCREVLQGLVRYYSKQLLSGISPEFVTHFVVNIYDEHTSYNEFSLLSNQRQLREYIRNIRLDSNVDLNDMLQILPKNIHCYFCNSDDPQYKYAHISFYEMPMAKENAVGRMEDIVTGVALNGLTSGIPSVLDQAWYKTGFGTKYATNSRLTKLASLYNALACVAFSGSSYEPNTCIFGELKSGQEGILGKIYQSSNWVVFIEPKVDLHFFQKKQDADADLMIIHYSDQYTSSSGYDDITVTQKTTHYNDIILEYLTSKGIHATRDNISDIINLFNAVNGSWMLKLISTKTPTGAIASNFSREKMSILAAIKICMAYYAHSDIIWIPISLEEMLRISGGAGLSQNDGLLSAKNLGFEHGPASDDILMVGVEGPKDDIKIYIHPVEVKIGQNPQTVLSKAHEQVLKTYEGLYAALWPEDPLMRNTLEYKVSRNFFMQLVIVCCEKMKLYNIYPDEHWGLVLSDYRQELLNEKYVLSERIVPYIGKGTIISFRTDAIFEYGDIDEDGVCLLDFPERYGAEYMVQHADQIKESLRIKRRALPAALLNHYGPESIEERSEKIKTDAIAMGGADDQGQYEERTAIRPPTEHVTGTTSEADDKKLDHSMRENYDNGIGQEEKELELLAQGDNTPSSMQILFGTDISTGEPLYWKPNDTNQVFHTNTGIIGTMGTGKTQFTKSIITQLCKEQAHNYDGHPLGVLIFDYKGDYNESKVDFVAATGAKVFKPYHLPFNPLALTRSSVFKPLLPIHTANTFKTTLSKVYDLGPKQENSLFTCIIAAYEDCGISASNPESWGNTPPTFDTVYRCYMENDNIKKNDSLAAAMEKLQQFEVFEADPDNTVSLFDMIDGVVVIDLSAYDSDIQSLIVAITLDLFYVQMQAAGSSMSNQQYRQLTKLILVDEADNFMSEGFISLRRILKEGREFGVGTILSTQFLKHFASGDDDYAKYILTWVVHNVADLKPADVEFVFKTEAKSATTQELFNGIKALRKHHSIVKLGNGLPQYIEDKAFWMLYREINQ